MRSTKLLILALILTGCNGGGSDSSTQTATSSSQPSATPSQSNNPSNSGGGGSSSSTTTTKPCQGKAIPIGSGNQIFSSFNMNTSPSSADQIFMYQDCTWSAQWADKTWNGGGTDYNASGTYSFDGNTITFLPSGIKFTITETPYRPGDPAYILSVANPDVLYALYTPSNVTNHAVKTGLAFVDWRVNTDLQNGGCTVSQAAFNTCMNNNYSASNLSGKSSTFYRD